MSAASWVRKSLLSVAIVVIAVQITLLGGKINEGIELMGFVHHGSPEEMSKYAKKMCKETNYKVLKISRSADLNS